MTGEPHEYRRARTRLQSVQRRALRFDSNENRADVARRLHDLIGTLIRDPRSSPDRTITEAALVQQLKSSRNAVRDALDLLRGEGRIERTRGVGSLSTGLKHFGWVDTLNDGEDPRTSHQLLRLAAMEDPPQPLVDWFAPEPGEHLVLLERLSTLDGVPRGVRTAYLRVTDLDRALADDYRGDFYSIIERLGVTAESADLYLSAEAADERIAQLLTVPAGAPLLLFENHTVDPAGRLVYLSYGRSRADQVGLVLRKAQRAERGQRAGRNCLACSGQLGAPERGSLSTIRLAVKPRGR